MSSRPTSGQSCPVAMSLTSSKLDGCEAGPARRGRLCSSRARDVLGHDWDNWQRFTFGPCGLEGGLIQYVTGPG